MFLKTTAGNYECFVKKVYHECSRGLRLFTYLLISLYLYDYYYTVDVLFIKYLPIEPMQMMNYHKVIKQDRIKFELSMLFTVIEESYNMAQSA